jgi:Lar family restriction alleviation protein
MSETKVELKKCPFCGGKAILEMGEYSSSPCYVICKKCGNRTRKYYTEKDRTVTDEAIAAWNRRVDNKLKMKR